jgi:DNA-binding response OmpR family regulator
MRILIVEDEYNLADVIKNKLEKEKYIVDISLDGEDGLYNALTDIYDLIILDVMLPYKNGFEILKEIRNKGINCKVIMLTAKSMLEDKLNGFDNGANDYLTKPFHIDELIARVNVQLKNSTDLKKKDVIEYGDLELDISSSKLTCIKTNNSVELVCKEFQLLEYFMNNPKQILSKEQLYDKIWGINNEIESNNLEVYLSFVRKKLKAIESNVNIKSSRGLGYKMEYDNE